MPLKKILVVTATVISIPSISYASDIRDATTKEIAVVKRAIADQLKDPGSMQLAHVKIANDGTLCGEVNAKNSYGGYAGAAKFIGIYFPKGKNKKPFASVLQIDSSTSQVAESMCLEKGM